MWHRARRSRRRTPRRRRRRRRRSGTPRRASRPGGARGSGSLRVLRAARLRRTWRDEILALVRRQRLVFGPLVTQALLLRARALGDALVVLARLAALLGAQVRPQLHAPLHALLLELRHLRIALGDLDPLLAPLDFERVPVVLERREDLLLLGGELGPRRADVLLHRRRLRALFRRRGRGWLWRCVGLGRGA